MNTDAFEVTGGISLSGEIIPQGAKNEALQVLCAVMLTDHCLLYTSPSPRDATLSRMPSSA